MKVTIKSFDVEMEVKNKGIELGIRSPDGSRQLGDDVLTKTAIIWCRGKTDRNNGVKISWEKFISLVEGAK